MNSRCSRRTVACALLATTALVTSPARAVDAAATPPVHQHVDSNGVDMALGTFDLSTPSLSIGPAAPHGLSYSRTNVGDGWRENVAATITQDPSGYIIVSVGGASDRFQASGSGYVNVEGDGATLTFNGAVYVYTNRDGTVANFDEANGDYDRYVADLGWIRDITFANGVKWTYQYLGENYCPTDPDPGDSCYLPEARSVRLEAVFSNTGYQLLFGYESDTLNVLDDLDAWQTLVSAKAIGNGIDYCNPVTGSCSVTKTWPLVTFSRTDTGSGWDETQTDATGAVTHYYSDYSDRLTGVRRPGAATNDISVTYGASDGHVSQITRAGVTYTYSWSDVGNVRTMTRTDPFSQTLTAVSAIDTSLVSSITDENGHTTSYQYDSNYRPTRVTEPEGNYAQYTYDARGNVTEKRYVAKPGSGLSDIVLDAGYDTTCSNPKTCNKPNWTKDALGNETDYTYDATHGGVLTVTKPAPTAGAVRPQTRISYSGLHAYYKQSATGSPIASYETIYLPSTLSVCQTLSSCAGGSDESKKTIAYGPQVAGTANNLLPVSVSVGSGDGALTAITAYTYDIFGNRITVDGPLSGTADTSMTRYDADRRTIGRISPDPDGAGPLKMRAVRTSWNGDGTVAKVDFGTVNSQSDADWSAFSASQTVALGYDSAGRKVTTKVSSGSTDYALTQTTYDALGRLACVATRMNSAAFGSLPSSGCTLTTQGSYGPDQIIHYIYDAGSQLYQIQVGVGTSDAANERTLAYSANGKVTALTDGENNKTTYVFDGFDRLSQTQYPSSTKGAGTSNSSDYEQLTYDANSNVTQRRVRSGATIVFDYDKLNRVTHKGGSAIADRDFTYDNLNRMLTAKFSTGGQGITNTYDALSRSTSSSSNMGGTAETMSYAYDAAGRRTQFTYPDGYYLNYDRLVTGEVIKIRENGAVSGLGVVATYAYDILGQRVSLTAGNGAVTTWSYDPVGRLSSLTQDLSGTTNDFTVTNTFSPASQIASQTRSNDVYAYTQSANVNRGYTSNGLNQYSAAGTASFVYDTNGNLTSDGTNTFGYNAENEMTSATVGAGAATLSYDPLGRLWNVVKGSTNLRFFYDGDQMVAHYDGTGTLQYRYIFGAGVDEELLQYNPLGVRTWYTADERGSIVADSSDSGSVSGINSYDEYGIPGSTNSGRFQYTGQMWVSELGMYFYKARAYSPTLGRFMQTDPVGYADGSNWYAYAHNDPVNLADPSGLGDEPAAEMYNTRPKDGSADIIVRADMCNACKSGELDPMFSQTFGDNLLIGGWGGLNFDITSIAQAPIVINGRRLSTVFNGLWKDFVKGVQTAYCAIVPHPRGGTMDGGVSGTLEDGSGGLVGSLKIAYDPKTTVALLISGGFAAGAGLEATGGPTVGGSNARTVADLAGPFVGGQGSAAVVEGLSASGYTGTTADGYRVWGGDVAITGGAGGSLAGTYTGTHVVPLVNLDEIGGCAG